MKVIIDIPKEEYGIIKNYKSFMPWAEGLIKKGVVIPDNATNGNMIKAMFPNAVIEIRDNTIYTNIDNGAWFSLDWWNAPYKKEVKE